MHVSVSKFAYFLPLALAALAIAPLGCDKSTVVTFSGATVKVDVAGGSSPLPPIVTPSQAEGLPTPAKPVPDPK